MKFSLRTLVIYLPLLVSLFLSIAKANPVCGPAGTNVEQQEPIAVTTDVDKRDGSKLAVERLVMPFAFACIVADPPWPYDAPGQFGCTLEHRPNRDTTLNKLGAGSRSRYGAMEIDDICELNPPAETDAHLYLWFTNAFAVEAHTIAKAWGFRPTTILTWTKVKPSGEPSMKMGYYFRGATEHVLFGVRGKLRLQTKRAVPTAMLWPRTRHSEKPEAFFDLVEECSPGPYLEMFARRKREGWIAWGNEIESVNHE